METILFVTEWGSSYLIRNNRNFRLIQNKALQSFIGSPYIAEEDKKRGSGGKPSRIFPVSIFNLELISPHLQHSV